ncbi:MAG: nucleotidyltransferase domain-containing protein [Pseudomonadota bacterium]
MIVIDPDTERVTRSFIERLSGQYDLVGAILFGSRARRNHRPDSDADIAVLLHGVPGRRVDEALKMADIAFDVMLETGVLVEAIPFWEDEWEHPERFSNPALIENIRREGIRL